MFSLGETSLNNTSWWKDFSGTIGSTTRENQYFGQVAETRRNNTGKITLVQERIVDTFGIGMTIWDTSLQSGLPDIGIQALTPGKCQNLTTTSHKQKQHTDCSQRWTLEIGNPFGTIRGATRDQEESQSGQEEDFTGGHTLEVTFGTTRKPIPLPGG